MAEIYRSLADVLRDQIGAQLESASTNDLKSVGLLAADLAIVVGMMVLRATDSTGIGSWWWWPVPAFAISALLLAIPVFPSRNNARFQTGPHVPSFVKVLSSEGPQTIEDMLARLLQALERTWTINDQLLGRESRYIAFGTYMLIAASAVTVGLYTWGLS